MVQAISELLVQPLDRTILPANIQEARIIISEVIFLVEEAHEGGFTAKALAHTIFTDADTWDELREVIRDAVSCHFEPGELPPVIRLHYVREEVLTR